jgi:hypothetical protein
MAETFVKNQVCKACGADVRLGSLFCYNCGESLAADAAGGPKKNNKTNSGGALLREEAPENNVLKTAQLGTEKFRSGETLEDAAEKPIPKPATIHEEAKLKSAANLRRKAKTIQRKRVEVVWEVPENAPNKWFPIFALLITLLVAGIFFLAMYLK